MNNQKGFANIIILIVVVVALVGLVIGSYFVLNRQTPTPPPIPTPRPTATTSPTPPANIEGARTLYEGYVEIEQISLLEIKTRLEEQDCHTIDYKEERNNWCMYRETEVPFFKENGIEIYPHGPGFGPISFYVTERKLWAGKDIPGSPNPDNFKAAVRQDVKDIGNIVKIKENSWKIIKSQYPWTVIY